MQGATTINGFGRTTLFASGLYFARKAGWDAQLNDAACRSLVRVDEICRRTKQFLLKKMHMEDSRS